MKFNFNVVMGHIMPKDSKSRLEGIIFSYADLKQKVENKDKQSFYFRKAMDSNNKRLVDLKAQFNEIRTFYNSATVELLEDEISENTKLMKELSKGGMGLIKQIAYYSKKSQNEYFEELIKLKRVTDRLSPLQTYIDRPDEFIKLIN